MDVTLIQRRTLRLLFVTQVVSGIAISIGASVGALLAADIASIGMSGVAQSAIVVGSALFAVPATSIVNRHGRRPSLAAGYFVAAVGAIIVVAAAVRGSVPLLFVGFFLFGGATAANFQARYAAVDLAPAALRGRHLSVIVWATTLGAVVGPSLAAFAGESLAEYGIPTLAGPFFFSALLFGLATLLLMLFLRPDPAVIARAASGDSEARLFRRRFSRNARRAPRRPLAGARPPGRERDGHRPPGDDRRHGHDAGTYPECRPRCGAYAAGRRHRAQLSHRGHVRVRAGLRLADRQARPAPRHRRGHRAAARRVCAGGQRGPSPGAPGRRADDARSGLVGYDGRRDRRCSATRCQVELRASAQGLSDLTMGLAGALAGAVSGVDRGGLGLSDADPARGARDGAAGRAGRVEDEESRASVVC